MKKIMKNQKTKRNQVLLNYYHVVHVVPSYKIKQEYFNFMLVTCQKQAFSLKF